MPILDLTAYKNSTLDITMMDGQVLHIRKPSQAMAVEVIKFREIKMDDPLTVIRATNLLTWMILNTNDDLIKVSKESVSNLSIEVQTEIIRAYVDFMAEVQSNPTTPSPASRAKKKTATPS